MPGELQFVQWLASLADEAPLLAALVVVVLLWRRDYQTVIKQLSAKGDYLQQLLERAIVAIERNSSATSSSTDTLKDLSAAIESLEKSGYGNPPFQNQRPRDNKRNT